MYLGQGFELESYVYYRSQGCDLQNDLFDGKVDEFCNCKAICDVDITCVSFEWYGERNPHPDEGFGVCHVSSSCTFEESEKYDGDDKPDLYVKGKCNVLL